MRGERSGTGPLNYLYSDDKTSCNTDHLFSVLMSSLESHVQNEAEHKEEDKQDKPPGNRAIIIL